MVTEHDKKVCEVYRTHHAECENMTDEEVMMVRGLSHKIIFIDKKPARQKSTAPRAPRVRPLTGKQFDKMCAEIRRDTKADMPEEVQDEGWWESACYDIAEGMLNPPGIDDRLEAYLVKTGVQPRYWKEYLADNIHG